MPPVGRDVEERKFPDQTRRKKHFCGEGETWKFPGKRIKAHMNKSNAMLRLNVEHYFSIGTAFPITVVVITDFENVVVGWKAESLRRIPIRNLKSQRHVLEVDKM